MHPSTRSTRSTRSARLVLAALACTALLAGAASAAPDQSGTQDLIEPLGFPGVCDQPCYTATKSFEVFLAGNPDPSVAGLCPAAENTYIYTITHTGGTGTKDGGTSPGFIPAIQAFEMAVDTAAVSIAFDIDLSGDIDAVGSATSVVRFDFAAPGISPGQTSNKLVVCSSLLPGTVSDVSVSGQAGLDAPGTCVGPVVPPAGGDPMPCTIGFWKNRADGKKGTLQHFPNGEFDQVVTGAVALSGGLFADPNALLTDLQSKGKRPEDQRARQQLAAFLLNLSAGDSFPENSKCRLFESNAIDSNSCGAGITAGDALADFFADYGAGQFLDAKDCADDVNNGIGVVGATEGG